VRVVVEDPQQRDGDRRRRLGDRLEPPNFQGPISRRREGETVPELEPSHEPLVGVFRAADFLPNNCWLTQLDPNKSEY
jgi:hypothetical protein